MDYDDVDLDEAQVAKMVLNRLWSYLDCASIQHVAVERANGRWGMVRISDGRTVYTCESKEEVERLIERRLEMGRAQIRGRQKRESAEHHPTSLKTGPKARKGRVIRKGEFPGQHIRSKS